MGECGGWFRTFQLQAEIFLCIFILIHLRGLPITSLEFCEDLMPAVMVLIGWYLQEVYWNHTMVWEEKSAMVLPAVSTFLISVNGALACRQALYVKIV